MAKKEMKKSKKTAQKSPVSLAAHVEQALQNYEQAIRLLQRKEYAEAAGRFKTIIADYPDEKEVADRCRLFLRVCERNKEEKVQPLKRVDDYYYQAVLESNRQQYDEALRHLDRALKMNPSDDRALYLMASTLALKGERDQAIERLREAIQANSNNRAHAQQDPDFDPLRDDDSFIELVFPARV